MGLSTSPCQAGDGRGPLRAAGCPSRQNSRGEEGAELFFPSPGGSGQPSTSKADCWPQVSQGCLWSPALRHLGAQALEEHILLLASPTATGEDHSFIFLKTQSGDFQELFGNMGFAPGSFSRKQQPRTDFPSMRDPAWG